VAGLPRRTSSASSTAVSLVLANRALLERCVGAVDVIRTGQRSSHSLGRAEFGAIAISNSSCTCAFLQSGAFSTLSGGA
jgi:hypothetical protein